VNERDPMKRLTHKFQLTLMPAQAEYFFRACGTARMVWNRALAEWNRQHEGGQKPKRDGFEKTIQRPQASLQGRRIFRPCISHTRPSGMKPAGS
jgi:hypothetical protein